MLEMEVFRTPSFSLKCSHARLKKIGYLKQVKSELIVFNMPPHYSFIFTTNLTRILYTKL